MCFGAKWATTLTADVHRDSSATWLFPFQLWGNIRCATQETAQSSLCMTGSREDPSEWVSQHTLVARSPGSAVFVMLNEGTSRLRRSPAPSPDSCISPCIKHKSSSNLTLALQSVSTPNVFSVGARVFVNVSFPRFVFSWPETMRMTISTS